MLWAQAGLAGPLVVEAQGSAPGWFDRSTEITLTLSEAVPVRAYHLAEPMRVVIDLDAEAFPQGVADPLKELVLIDDVQAGRLSDTQVRLILTLARPAIIDTLEMTAVDDGGVLTVRLTPVRADAFVAEALPPPPAPRALARSPRQTRNTVLVVLDAGHGGIDPGAVRAGIAEKDIALVFAHELAAALDADPRFEVVMTRIADVYLGLRARVDLARSAEADLFLSIHANTVTEGVAQGAALYTLSATASDEEAEALADRENAAELFPVAPRDADAGVSTILLDLAQRETNARSTALALHIVPRLRETVGVIRSRPHRSAGFVVLKAPDIPSVLVELGFLSHPQDRENMQSARWRAEAIEGLMRGLNAFVEEDAILATRTKQ
ncbi:MAG: N-acetylmuramoyl-L-alanine amidase [Pseudomonadota bacterium]